jgi:hypothetical protein
MENPQIDYAAARLASHQSMEAARSALFAKPAILHPAPPLAPFVGNFVNPVFGSTAVAESNGALTLTFAETGSELKLAAWDADLFAVSPDAATGRQSRPGARRLCPIQIDQNGKLNQLCLSIEDYRVADQADLFQ